MNAETKTCPKCKTIFEGRGPYCAPCRREYQRAAGRRKAEASGVISKRMQGVFAQAADAPPEGARFCPRCQQNVAHEKWTRIATTGKFHPYCTVCRSDYRKEQYATRPEVRQKAIEGASRRLQDPIKKQKIVAYQAVYREAHRQENRQREADRRCQYPELMRLRAKASLAKPEVRARMLARQKETYRRRCADPEKHAVMMAYARVAAKAHYYRHRERVIKESAARERRRHAIKLKARTEGFNDVQHYEDMRVWQQGRCYYCNRPLTVVYHREHIVALSRGGSHSRQNLVLSCDFCNLSKSKRPLHKVWTPKIKASASLTVPGPPGVIVVSAFAASDRSRDDAMTVVQALHVMQPGVPIVFDSEAARRPAAFANLMVQQGAAAPTGFSGSAEVVEVGVAEARAFLEANHLQGFAAGALHTALQVGDDLVGLASWLLFDDRVEMSRLCFKGRVAGGASRLVGEFVRAIGDDAVPVVAYVDPRTCDGRDHEAAGFVAVGETKGVPCYYVGADGIFSRQAFAKPAQKIRMDFYDETLTEYENARVNGYYRVYGLKQRRYLLDRSRMPG